jgi:hypothetical protein
MAECLRWYEKEAWAKGLLDMLGLLIRKTGFAWILDDGLNRP